MQGDGRTFGCVMCRDETLKCQYERAVCCACCAMLQVEKDREEGAENEEPNVEIWSDSKNVGSCVWNGSSAMGRTRIPDLERKTAAGCQVLGLETVRAGEKRDNVGMAPEKVCL